MNEMDRLEEALKAMREADTGRGASDFAETRLRAAFRAHHSRPRRRWWASPLNWAAAAAAVVVIVLAVSRAVSPDPVQAPSPKVAKSPQVAPAPSPAAVAAEAPVVAAHSSRKPARRPIRRNEPKSAVAVSAGPSLEDFMAIPYAPPFTRNDQGQVVRVRVPRQSLRSLGLPVNEERMLERVPADLLLGEDGVPRAIRFVNDRR